LRGLLRAQAYLTNRGCELHLRRVSSQVRRVIDLIGITSMLTFVDGSDGDTPAGLVQDGGEASPAG
jgi:anti-anti-sigma regulatory factor